MVEGRCLCGEVRVAVDAPLSGTWACFCDLCATWGGGVQMGVEVPAAALTFSGPVKTHRSSRLSERAWCDTCGSDLWMRDVTGEATDRVDLSPGLFGRGGAPGLDHVVYADRAPAGFGFAPGVRQVSQGAYDAANPNLNEGS